MNPAAEKRRRAKEVATKAKIQKTRTDVWFMVYYEMGPDRSLELLQQHATALGQRRSINTFKRWSSDYDWQQRVVEEDTRRAEHDQADAVRIRSEMMARQGKIGRTMQVLAAGGMLNLQDLMKSGRLDIAPKDIATLAKAGTDIELRAAGEPTHRIEVTTVLYNVLIARIARIFKEANVLPTIEAREARFATLVDQTQVNAMEEVQVLLEQGKG